MDTTVSNTITPEQIDAWRKARAAAAAQEIQAVLEKLDCELVAVPGLTPDGRVIASVKLIAH